MTEQTLLFAGMALQVTILMVLLARILPNRINRWANIVVAILTAGFVLTNGATDLDDIFFAAVEIAALGFIVWAWRWPEKHALSDSRGVEAVSTGD